MTEYSLKGGMVYSAEDGKYLRRDLYISAGVLYPTPSKGALEIDITGKFVYPGFVDSHAHLIGTGRKSLEVNLEDCNSIESLAERLEVDREVVRARGWDQEVLGFMPVREVLDSITTRPVILTRRCGHIATVNSPLIKLFSLEGLHGLDGSDIELGLLKERALEELDRKIKLSPGEVERAIHAGTQAFLKYGVTAVHSDDYHGIDYELLMQSLSSTTNMRIYEKFCVSKEEQLDLIKLGQQFETPFFNLRAAKLYLDGSLGARTAAMISPYHDSPAERGVLYMTADELRVIVKKADREGIQVCVHVIGDRALEEALKAFEGSVSESLKHRLIHVQIASEEQIKRMADQKLTASIQPIFADSDRIIAPERFGPLRMKDAYPFGKLRDMGVTLAISTDSPVEGTSVIRNLTSADRFFSRRDSIQMYSSNGHILANNTDSISLKYGDRADLFVINVDLLKATQDTPAEMTFVDGRLVYRL
ncbi:MAG: amidohydrolase family protein [Thermotogaceae bacterium]|nr:amidohydrolase family protein [Thermotogaceae bacterium]